MLVFRLQTNHFSSLSCSRVQLVHFRFKGQFETMQITNHKGHNLGSMSCIGELKLLCQRFYQLLPASFSDSHTLHGISCVIAPSHVLNLLPRKHWTEAGIEKLLENLQLVIFPKSFRLYKRLYIRVRLKYNVVEDRFF